MDGFEAMYAIRRKIESGEIAQVPVVAMTASCTAHDRARCQEAGMQEELLTLPPLANKSDLLFVFVLVLLLLFRYGHVCNETDQSA